ncbi:MAG: multifunctional CCA addition/repair protein, partial [Pseudomonadota bacterium]|nr:multifunctional CCA addition/repair protein [Pseudomonadota bacterium]
MTDPAEQLECYLVGGAVRDQLLGLDRADLDWLVIGASGDEMTRLGFKSVGRDFPVFLHPKSHQEYALARRERKIAPGYRGFETDTGPEVTLEEDLSRRDLTINAMARSRDGVLIDPYGGQADLGKKILRHVSDAFIEDPVRVLRVARFTARYHHLGFTVAPETLELMQTVVERGETQALVAERVWQELRLALGENTPAEFFRVLHACGALGSVLPEIQALFGVPQPPEHHPEGDAGQHTLMVLDAAARLSDDTRVRFAALVHDLGKSTTPRHQWPRHIGHEKRGLKLVKGLCQRLRIPEDHRRLALAVTEYHLLMHKLKELRPETVLKLLAGLDAFRNPDRVESFILACEADAQGRGTE